MFKSEAADNEKISSMGNAVHKDKNTNYEASCIVDILNDMNKKYKSIAECCCYFPEIDMIVTSKSFSDSESYYRLNVANGQEEYEKWKTDISGNTLMFLSKKIKNGEGYITDIFDVIIPVYNNGKMQFTLHAYLNVDSVFGSLNNDELNKDSFFLILNQRGKTVIGSISDYAAYDLSNILFEEEYLPYRIKLNGSNYLMYYLNSFQHNYRYAYFVPVNWLQEITSSFVIMSFIAALICLAVILFIVMELGNWHSFNLRTILKSLDDKYEIQEIGGNEYQIIQKKIKFVKNKSDKMEHDLHNQSGIVRSCLLLDYIKGNKIYNLEKRFEENNINFSNNYFAIIAIVIQDYGILKDDTDVDAILIINNIFEDVTGTGKENFFLAKSGEALFYIYNCENDNPEEFKKYISDIFGETNKITQENLELSFLAATSSIAKGPESLPSLYNEAIYALETGHLYGVSDFVFFDEIQREYISESFYKYPKNKINELILYIKDGNSDKAVPLVNELFEAALVEKRMSKWHFDGLVHIIINSILDANSVKPDILEKIDNLKNITTINDTVDAIRGIINEICEQNRCSHNNPNRIYNLVKSYVDENFTDCNLNIAFLGEKFNMSSYYISRLFKECSGVKLNNYITDLRMDCAKRLLREDNRLKIEDIAERVGFENKRTFLKLFKEKEGITPTQYKNLSC